MAQSYAEINARLRDEAQDLSVSVADKSSRVDLGLAIMERIAKPNTQYTLQEIAIFCGCSKAAVMLMEQKAMRKIRNNSALMRIFSECMLVCKTTN